ncbi:MAG: pilin [Nanoarchaeota archaeon]|nr:pilin [Nanoarchaeota archaeon]
MKKILLLMMLLALLVVPNVLAVEQQAGIDTQITQGEKDQFDAILSPIFKIYNFVKYIVTVVAAIFLLYAGISYMTSGNDPRKRDQAKNIAMYVIIGMLIIWASPLIIGLLI